MSLNHEEKERARDREIVSRVHNTARFFSEKRHVAWVALIFTMIWGLYAYVRMPKAKDPTVEVRIAVASCAWPGAAADKVEQLVTRKIEKKLAENANLEKIESISRSSVSIVYVTLKESVKDRSKEWNDIQARLETITDLPPGAGPVQFQKDFGDTTTLMLTVASPRVSDVELDLRATSIERTIEAIRAQTSPSGERATLVLSFPPEINASSMQRLGGEARAYFDELPGVSDARYAQSPGFLALDLRTDLDDDTLVVRLRDFAEPRMPLSELHPDVWHAMVVRDPKDTRAKLAKVAGSRYSHHDLDLFTDTIQRHLRALPIVSKVTRSGVLPEQITLNYSQQKLVSYGLDNSRLSSVIGARNITAPGGVIEVSGKNVSLDPSGEFTDASQIGDVAIAATPSGSPVYLRDVVDVSREYQTPPRFLNFLSVFGPDGQLDQLRAVTLAITMRPGAQVGDFAKAVNAELDVLERILPEELIFQRTSDQPRQVEENVGLFMSSLYEAVVLVVLVALIGFWEWRSALLLALCIPITLAMTFGLMHLFGIDLQQISIASLIIALGLLVDDPVVASDAIKHSMGAGWKPKVAAWLGPTKLATAIMFATLTNIAAYLPFLTLSGDVGTFIYSLPVVLSLSLVASRIVSMTFVPLLGGSLLRAPTKSEPSMHARRSRGFGRIYYRVVGWAIDHRHAVFIGSLVFLVAGGFAGSRLKQAFFPTDLSYLSYVDVWLPEDSTLSATRDKSAEVRSEIERAAKDFAEHDPHAKHEGRVLESVTEFIGGGGPRFWFSVSPELQQLNYAQLLIQLNDKELTRFFVPYLQERLSKKVAGARVDVRQLESGKPVGVPIAVRISGENIETLRTYAEKAKAIFRETPGATRVRDDWGSDTFAVDLRVDPDRANLAGVTNLDVARSSAGAMNGALVGSLREGDRVIPIVTRLRPEERSRLSDVQDLYVYAHSGDQKVPLRQVSSVVYTTQTEKIRRRNQFRTITVSCFPQTGFLSSEVLAEAHTKLDELRRSMPPGYRLEIGGEKEEQTKSFGEMAIVAGLLVVAIYLALVLQFKNAFKPLIVFASLPYGVAAALAALAVTGSPLGFMAILGIISLMGVIVSHVIVLFDFIEEMSERGEPMREALLDAGLMRVRPVFITVVATVLGLFPLAMHGGPLWEPLCYAQIGGLTFATLVTLVLVPVLYTIFIEDLKLVKWQSHTSEEDPLEQTPPVLATTSSDSRGSAA